jgi:TolB-like protein/class 3 adenylate cyclase/tetratricopeptide (TPR) repeat protein
MEQAGISDFRGSFLTGERVERRLAAILAADVVGYSRLVSADEADALTRLGALRRAIIEPNIANHSGRLFKIMGDGFLAEFTSAVQAVSCALAIQTETEAAASNFDDAQKMRLRIGIHVGDVMVEGEDLLGDGINIAARLESIAAAGGISISRAVHDQVRDRIKITFDDKGEVALKNIARPVQVFAVAGAKSAAPVQATPSTLALPDKPSIAVLPFQNMSGDMEQEYFADGMVEDITTALSRIRWLYVIARNSSFTYKGKAVDIKMVGRELGVRYVLEGSIRRASNRIRITGQLIDVLSGAHIWADRFEGGVEDVFDLQDQVTARVVGAIAPKLEQAEIERSRRKPTENLVAYDYYLQAMSCTHKFTKEANEQALHLFQRAIDLDPEFASSFAQAALCYSQRKAFGWSANPKLDAEHAELLARKALNLAKDDPLVLACSAMALAFVVGQVEEGAGYAKKATDLDPNLAAGWYWRGWTQIYLGKAEAVEHFQKAIRLSPLDPRIYTAYSGVAYGYFLAEQYDDASKWAEAALMENSKYLVAHLIAMACHALSGRLDAAKEVCSRAMQLDPPPRISSILERVPLRRQHDISRLTEGCRLAGMPE